MFNKLLPMNRTRKRFPDLFRYFKKDKIRMVPSYDSLVASFFISKHILKERIVMINIKEDESLSVLNHSGAHLLAQAVKHLYPKALFWVGPVIAEGFYYDIDLGDIKLNEEDLAKIEKEMKKIAKDGKKIVRHELTRDEALEMFKDDPYKIDLIKEMSDDTVISCYTQGDFTDLCRGPHVDSVKELKYFKLLKVSGAKNLWSSF